MDMLLNKNDSTPIYMQVATILRNRIIDGTYSPGYRFPAENDFAAALGINHQTLRKSFRILADQHLIKQQRGKGTFVIRAEDPLYRIAVLGYDEWFGGMFDALSAARIETIQIPSLTSDNTKTLWEIFSETKAHALVLYGQSRKVLAQLAVPEFDSVPCVAMNARPEETGNRQCVNVQQNPIHPAVEHLAKLGHRRIGFISRKEKTSNMLERDKSFMDALIEFGLDTSPDLIVHSEGTHFESGKMSAPDLIFRKNPVSAIICSGAAISLGAMYGLMKAGVRIPEDVSLVGYDIKMQVNPYLSTLIQPQSDMAFYAGKLLLSMLKKEPLPKPETFQVHFEDRGSTGVPNKKFL